MTSISKSEMAGRSKAMQTKMGLWSTNKMPRRERSQTETTNDSDYVDDEDTENQTRYCRLKTLAVGPAPQTEPRGLHSKS